jgi:hypothetical protein
MSFGHAERNLAAVRVLCAETIWLLADRQVLTPDEKQWLDEVTAGQQATRERVGRTDHAGCTSTAGAVRPRHHHEASEQLNGEQGEAPEVSMAVPVQWIGARGRRGDGDEPST